MIKNSIKQNKKKIMHLLKKQNKTKNNLCLRRPMQFKPMLFKGQLCRQNFLKKEDLRAVQVDDIGRS